MKLKCKDKLTRRFRVSFYDSISNRWVEGECLECGKKFGVHDTHILKTMFKNHICKRVEGSENINIKETRRS